MPHSLRSKKHSFGEAFVEFYAHHRSATMFKFGGVDIVHSVGFISDAKSALSDGKFDFDEATEDIKSASLALGEIENEHLRGSAALGLVLLAADVVNSPKAKRLGGNIRSNIESAIKDMLDSDDFKSIEKQHIKERILHLAKDKLSGSFWQRIRV